MDGPTISIAMNNILLSCDWNYYNSWTKACIKSIQHYNPWINITVHIINPENHDKISGVRYEYEEVDVSSYKEPVAYYQAARFIKAAELFDDSDLVMSLDCDTVCTESFTKDEFEYLASQVSVLLHHKADRWLAGLVTYGKNNFRHDYRQRLLNADYNDWVYGLDQVILEDLSHVYQFNKVRVGTWMSLGKGKGTFLTLKGTQKVNSKYLGVYNNTINTINEKQSWALSGPWTGGIPLPDLENIQVKKLQDLGPGAVPDIWIIHNNTDNKRTKRYLDAYEYVRSTCIPWIVVESPAFRYNQADQDSKNVYYRWSWLSYFRDQGIHYDENSPGDRWKRIQKEQNIKIHNWQSRGDNILFMMQRPGDSSLVPLTRRYGSYENFVRDTIQQLREFTDRPIKIRMHPLRFPQQMEILQPLLDSVPDVTISDHSRENTRDRWISGGDSLYADFDHSWAVVGANSNSLTESVCYGVPTWCLNSTAMAYPVSQQSLQTIENPDLHTDRTQWLYNLAYSQWRLDEIKQGVPFKHLMQWYDRAVELRKAMPDYAYYQRNQCHLDPYAEYWNTEYLTNIVKQNKSLLKR